VQDLECFRSTLWSFAKLMKKGLPAPRPKRSIFMRWRSEFESAKQPNEAERGYALRQAQLEDIAEQIDNFRLRLPHIEEARVDKRGPN
jgi:hypothetical protein